MKGRGFRVTSLNDVANWSPQARDAIRQALGEDNGEVVPLKKSPYVPNTVPEREQQQLRRVEVEQQLAVLLKVEPPVDKNTWPWKLARLVRRIRGR